MDERDSPTATITTSTSLSILIYILIVPHVLIEEHRFEVISTKTGK